MSEDIDQAYTREHDPIESLQAADSVNTGMQMEHLLNVMRILWELHRLPASDGDIYTAASKHGFSDTAQGLRSRRHEAVIAGWVKRVDRDGRTSTGRRCSRWTITCEGVIALAKIQQKFDKSLKES